MTPHADRDHSERPVWPSEIAHRENTARQADLDEPVPYLPTDKADRRTEVDRIARLLIAEWERVDGPVNVSRVANFADMARVIVAEQAALRSGADPTPTPENAWPTAGQLWHQLLEAPVDERLDRLGRYLDAAREALQCFLMNHEALQDEVEHLRAALATARDDAITEMRAAILAELRGAE